VEAPQVTTAGMVMALMQLAVLAPALVDFLNDFGADVLAVAAK
jgi:hypothetical protein